MCRTNHIPFHYQTRNTVKSIDAILISAPTERLKIFCTHIFLLNSINGSTYDFSFKVFFLRPANFFLVGFKIFAFIVLPLAIFFQSKCLLDLNLYGNLFERFHRTGQHNIQFVHKNRNGCQRVDNTIPIFCFTSIMASFFNS